MQLEQSPQPPGFAIPASHRRGKRRGKRHRQERRAGGEPVARRCHHPWRTRPRKCGLKARQRLSGPPVPKAASLQMPPHLMCLLEHWEAIRSGHTRRPCVAHLPKNRAADHCLGSVAPRRLLIISAVAHQLKTADNLAVRTPSSQSHAARRLLTVAACQHAALWQPCRRSRLPLPMREVWGEMRLPRAKASLPIFVSLCHTAVAETTSLPSPPLPMTPHVIILETG